MDDNVILLAYNDTKISSHFQDVTTEFDCISRQALPRTESSGVIPLAPKDIILRSQIAHGSINQSITERPLWQGTGFQYPCVFHIHYTPIKTSE